jgi:hypothetical protein
MYARFILDRGHIDNTYVCGNPIICLHVKRQGGVPGENPPTIGKQLLNFITCDCESSAPFFVIYNAGREPIYRPGQLYILSSRVDPDTTDTDVHALCTKPAVLKMKESGKSSRNHWTVKGTTETCRHRTHAVLVIGLYELLDNPTTQLIEPPSPWKTWGCQLTFIERCAPWSSLQWCEHYLQCSTNGGKNHQPGDKFSPKH